MDYSLNNEDVAKISGYPITMIPYTDVCMYNEIEDLFATDRVLLNYLSTKNYGHWVGLYKKGNKISFFDSYGRLPDSQLEYIPLKYRVESNQDYPYLVALLKKWVDENPKRSIHYNDEQFQRYSSKITTCGRWVGFYFRFADDESIEKFEKKFEDIRDEYFKNNRVKALDRDMFFDRLIVNLTEPYL